MNKTVIAATSVVLLITCLLNVIALHAKAQPNNLQLEDIGLQIENHIELKIKKGEYDELIYTKGKRIYFKSPEAKINGEKLAVKELHTRGKTTLHMRRKSLSFGLGSKAKFKHGQNKASMKKFNAVSLSMDKNYIRNRLAFEMMEELGLFGLFFSYSEIVINGETEGIYMIIERPQDWALKSKDSPFIIRRGFDNKIEKIKTGKEVDKSEIKDYKTIFNSIYKNLKKYDGEEFYKTYSEWLDLEMYMQWLAFNYFVRNGDYTDEVYFYIDPTEKRYKIIPWDYDDIFAREPHEGKHLKKNNMKGKYIFSSEDKLDQKIASDPYLYSKYLDQLKLVLEKLHQDLLGDIFQSTYAELHPYFSRQDILEISRNDTYKGASLESLKKELQTIYEQLVMTRLSFLKKIEEQLD